MDGLLRRIIKGFIILAGLLILLYPSISEYLSEKNATKAIEAYEDAISKTEKAKLEEALAAAAAYNRLLITGRRVDDRVRDGAGHPVSQDSYKNLLNVTGNGVMGYIYIPKLKVKINIQHGTKDTVMQTAVGHQCGQLKQLVIPSHYI